MARVASTRWARRLRLVLAALVVLGALAALSPAPARAATCVATSTADAGGAVQ